jgi:hypothetical protein
MDWCAYGTSTTRPTTADIQEVIGAVGTTVAFSPDGKMFASGGEQVTRSQIWDLTVTETT